MKYKAVISDIDGTLTEVKMGALPSDKVTTAVKRAMQQGITFSLATGRPFDLVEYLVKHLELTSPIIVDNGAAIYDSQTGDILHEATIDHAQAEEIHTIVKEYTKVYHISCSTQNLDPLDTIPEVMTVRKFVVHGLLPAKAEELIQVLSDRYKNLSLSKASANEGTEFMDVYVTDANATKQYAILKYAEIVGIDTKEIIAIGDHYNDFPLFMACGFKVAMGNAVDDLKAIADYVAPSVENDGVADVLEKFV